MKYANPIVKRYRRDFTTYFTNKKLVKKSDNKMTATEKKFIEVKENLLMPDLTINTYRLQDGTLIWNSSSFPMGYIEHDDSTTIKEKYQPEILTKQQQKLKRQIMKLKEVLEKKFVNVDQVAEILEIGFVAEKNVFLYGRGGHAKSEIIQEFLKYVDPEGSESFVQACGEGLSEEKLFGGLNLQKFQKTGEIEYLVENSFMNKKYVVFEELLDSRMNVLLSLKDILTSGTFRQGNQQFKIKTKFVVCLTNRTKQEVSEDNSIKALMERFPLEMKVEWDKYEANDYSKMFSKVLGDKLDRVATICQQINECGEFVSPRTAIHMGQVYRTTGRLTDLKYFGASSEIISKVEKLEKEKKEIEFLEKKKKEYSDIVNNECDCISEYKKMMKDLKEFLNTINTSYTGSAFPIYASLKQNAIKSLDNTRDRIVQLIENE